MTGVQTCALPILSDGAFDFLVASGSLPPGAPDNLYARMANRVPSGTKFVLDTSGAELETALGAGGLFLVKPSKGELEQLAGRRLASREEIADCARELINHGGAKRMVVTCGRDGAIMADIGGAWYLPAVPVQTRSTVGAGDSFLAGMIYGFATGQDPSDCFRFGAACGAASALSPGTGLAHPDDARRLLENIALPLRI